MAGLDSFNDTMAYGDRHVKRLQINVVMSTTDDVFNTLAQNVELVIPDDIGKVWISYEVIDASE